jgi:hypothetical protein
MKKEINGIIIAIIESICDTEKTAFAGKNIFKLEEDDLPTFHLELVCLLVASVDLAAFLAFRSNLKDRSDFMDSFYEKFEAHYDWMPAEAANHFFTILDSRVDIYAKIGVEYEDYDFQIAYFFSSLFDRQNDQETIDFTRNLLLVHTKKIQEIIL